MAEGLFREMTKNLSGIEIDSAGLSAPPNRAPSQHSINVLKEQGIDISAQRSQQLTPELIRESTHIFGMTIGHKEAIEMLFPAAAEKTFLIRELADGAEADDANHGLLDVPDPIGLDRDAYEITRDLIQEALPAVLKFVQETDG